jgi:hypothetical protein
MLRAGRREVGPSRLEVRSLAALEAPARERPDGFVIPLLLLLLMLLLLMLLLLLAAIGLRAQAAPHEAHPGGS